MPKHYAPIAGVNAEEFIGELPGWLFSTIKYIWRAPNKNGVEEAIEHARRNLITDEDPKNITSYTGFAQ
jgi:hypothetical protein